MFELAAAKGERSYNWDNKVMVQLRAEEIGNLLASPEISHQFYHDTCKPAVCSFCVCSLLCQLRSTSLAPWHQ